MDNNNINKSINEHFQRLQDDLLLDGLGSVSTSGSQPSKTLTMDTLQAALDAVRPEPEFMFFVNMNSILGTLRLLRKEGLRWKRVKDRNWIKIYNGLLFLGDLYVDPHNTFNKGEIGRIKKDKLQLKYEREFKPVYQPFIETGFRPRYRWGK